MKRRDFVLGTLAAPFILSNQSFACAGDGPYAYYFKKDNLLSDIDNMDDYFNAYYGKELWQYSDELDPEELDLSIRVPERPENPDNIPLFLNLNSLPVKYTRCTQIEFFNEAGTALYKRAANNRAINHYAYKIGRYSPSNIFPIEYSHRYRSIGTLSRPYVAFTLTDKESNSQILVYRHNIAINEHTCGSLNFKYD